MATDNHCLLLGSKLLAPLLNNLLDWLRQEPGKLLLKTKVSCGRFSLSLWLLNEKSRQLFCAFSLLSQSALTDTMMTVYFLQSAWLMRFQFFSNTKIICCGLVINRSNSKYHYQFRERVEQETLSKQFNPLEHATAKKLHWKYRLLLCHTQNFVTIMPHIRCYWPPPGSSPRLWLTMTRHSSLGSLHSAPSLTTVSHSSLWRPGCARHSSPVVHTQSSHLTPMIVTPCAPRYWQQASTFIWSHQPLCSLLSRRTRAAWIN